MGHMIKSTPPDKVMQGGGESGSVTVTGVLPGGATEGQRLVANALGAAIWQDPSDGVRVTKIASAALSGHRVVRSLGATQVAYADPSNVSHATHVLGMTTHAAAFSSPIDVLTFGEIEESSWSWVPDGLIYFAANGVLTQVSPVAGFTQVVGFALSSTKIMVELRAPIMLI